MQRARQCTVKKVEKTGFVLLKEKKLQVKREVYTYKNKMSCLGPGVLDVRNRSLKGDRFA